MSHRPPITLGELIRSRRLDLGMTASDLAHEADVVPGTIHNWEQGRRRPMGPGMRRLAAALRLPVEDLRRAPTGAATSPQMQRRRREPVA